MLLACAIAAAIALVACLLQNFSKSSMESVWMFDSGHYLSSSQTMLNLWRHLLGGDKSTLLSACLASKDALLADGPIVPSLGALACLLVNSTSIMGSAPVLLVLQACLHAISAALVCLLAKRLTGNRGVALGTAITWALYGPAVIGAGKFMSETLTTVLLLLLVVSASSRAGQDKARAGKIAWLAGMSGLVTGTLMLTKPALCWPAFVVCALAHLNERGKVRRALAILSLLAGMAAPVIPWAAYSRVTTGQLSFMNQRLPTLNVVTGMDPETDGWGCLWEAPFVKMFPHNEDTLPVFLGICLSHPQESLSLILRKTVRLWADPWNDFRFKLFGLPVAVQQWWHRLLLCAGIAGICAFASGLCAAQNKKDQAFSVGLFSIVLIAGHLTYLLVAANCRYGFTAMPLLLLFAGYLSKCPLSANKRKLTHLTAMAAILAFAPAALAFDLIPFLSGSASLSCLRLEEALLKIALLSICLFGLKRMTATAGTVGALPFWIAWIAVFSVACAQATNTPELSEWASTFSHKDQMRRRFFLPDKTKMSPDWGMIVFDSDEAGQYALASVNGKRVAGTPASLCFYSSNSNDIGALQIYASVLRTRCQSLRQWRALPLPLSYLRFNEMNSIELAAAPGTRFKLYGSFTQGEKRMDIPSLTLHSATKLLSSATCIDPRLIDRNVIDLSQTRCERVVSGKSLADLSAAPGFQTGQYHCFLLLGYACQPGDISVNNLNLSHTEHIKMTAKTGSNNNAVEYEATIPQSLIRACRLRFKFSALARSKQGLNDFTISGKLKGDQAADSYFLAGTPRQQPLSDAWTPVSIAGEYPGASLPAGQKSFAVSIYSPRVAAEASDAWLDVTTLSGPSFSGHVTKAF